MAEEMMEEELRALFIEGRWFIVSELPRVGKILLNKIAKTLKSLKTEEELISFQSEIVNIPAKLPYKGPRLRGNIKLSGTHVSDGEIFTVLRNYKHKKTQEFNTRMTGKPGLPVIPDVEYCYNYLQSSYNTLETLMKRHEEVLHILTSEEFTEENVIQQQQVLRDIKLSVEEITQFLVLAKKELVTSRQIEFPTAASHFRGTVSSLDRDFSFQPRPPPQVLIHISITNIQLKVSVFFLEVMPNRPSNVQRPNSKKGYSYKLNNNQWVEVVDHLETNSNVVFIQEAVESITDAYDLCVGIRDKMICIDSH